MEESKKEHPLPQDREAHQVLPQGHSGILGFMQDFRLRKEANVSVFKRGSIYYYEFLYRGQRYRESTRLTNKTAALRVEALRKADVLKGRGFWVCCGVFGCWLSEG